MAVAVLTPVPCTPTTTQDYGAHLAPGDHLAAAVRMVHIAVYPGALLPARGSCCAAHSVSVALSKQSMVYLCICIRLMDSLILGLFVSGKEIP